MACCLPSLFMRRGVAAQPLRFMTSLARTKVAAGWGGRCVAASGIRWLATGSEQHKEREGSSPLEGHNGKQGLIAGVDLRKDVFTIPNILTMGRIAASPLIGYCIVHEAYSAAFAGVVLAGVSDLLDGYIARRYDQKSPLGTVLDPFADKFLMTTLTLSLAAGGLLSTPLAALIIGRDAVLVASAFVIRYKTLPPPRTLQRYFNVSVAPAEVQPTTISKFNTAMQLALVSASVAAPVFNFVGHPALTALSVTVACTTIASGISYLNLDKVIVWRGK